MVGGMGTGKAGAMRTIIYKKAQLRAQHLILAGPGTPNGLLYQLAADEVAQGGAQHYAHYPPPTFYAEIRCYKQQKEQVQGNPGHGFPYKWQNGVQERGAPILVNMGN